VAPPSPACLATLLSQIFMGTLVLLSAVSFLTLSPLQISMGTLVFGVGNAVVEALERVLPAARRLLVPHVPPSPWPPSSPWACSRCRVRNRVMQLLDHLQVQYRTTQYETDIHVQYTTVQCSRVQSGPV